jgi:hypothetical protein
VPALGAVEAPKPFITDALVLGHAVGVHHQTVQRCVERAAVEGPVAALDDRLPPGKAPTITAEAKAWIKDLACRKAKELGYPHELWTTRLLASHAREHGPADGHACLGKLVQGTVPASRRLLRQRRICRPPMRPSRAIMNISVTARSACWPASICSSGHALVKDRHRSREFIEFLELLDAAYPACTAIKLILDNHSAHISKKTRAWVAEQPAHRFESPSPHARFLAQPHRGLLLQTRPFGLASYPCSDRNKSSRIASWPPWITSINSRPFTPSPSSSIRLVDMIRMETLI